MAVGWMARSDGGGGGFAGVTSRLWSPSADPTFIFRFSSSWLGRRFYKPNHLMICSTHQAEVSLSLSLQHPWGGYRVMIRSRNDSIGCWSAALEAPTAPSGIHSVQYDFWFLNNEGKDSSGGSRGDWNSGETTLREAEGGGRPDRKSL